VIARGILRQVTIELRPPRLKVLLLERSNLTNIHGPPHPYVILSINDTVRHLCSLLATTVGSADKAVNAARIWKVEGKEFIGMLYPSGRLHFDAPEILTPSDQTLEDAMIEPEDAFVVEFLENGSFIVDPEKLPSKSSSSTTTIQPEVPPPLFSSGDDFFSQMGKKQSSWSTASSSKYAFPSKPNHGFYKSSGSGSMTTRSLPIQDLGTLGLGNMYGDFAASMIDLTHFGLGETHVS
jgi:ubiquitin carboxyl-terminal hydrolase 4/11